MPARAAKVACKSEPPRALSAGEGIDQRRQLRQLALDESGFSLRSPQRVVSLSGEPHANAALPKIGLHQLAARSKFELV